MKSIAERVLVTVSLALQERPAESRAWLGVSGGLDSMLLLEAAVRSGAERLGVLHVNHGLRGPESDADEEFVRAAASALGLPFRSVRLEWREERPSQAACRRRREEFFAAQLGEGDLLVLAHHADDQAETLLLRLLRGTGLDGLAGMATRNGQKCRPLLPFTRAEIREVADLWKLQWREDSSNQSSKYDRNWLRLEIISRMEARRPGFASRLAALAEEVRAERPAKNGADLFRDGDFIFGRRSELRALSDRDLKNLFLLSREPTRQLARLLEKGSGQWAAAGMRFRLSQGVLLVEKGGTFRDQLRWGSSERGRVAESALGEWVLSDTAVAGREGVASGEKAKKRFQEKGVPVFFRDSLPVSPGAARIFLPGDSGSPSALGRWWLNSL